MKLQFKIVYRKRYVREFDSSITEVIEENPMDVTNARFDYYEDAIKWLKNNSINGAEYEIKKVYVK